MKKIIVLNGPNLNLLGTREPEKYGSSTLADVETLCKDTAKRLGFDVEFLQSNHEGPLIDKIQEAGMAHRAGTVQGIVFNPGAYTHTSVIEVHISNVHAREAFRHHSFISPVAAGIVVGFGIQGYALAMEGLAQKN